MNEITETGTDNPNPTDSAVVVDQTALVAAVAVAQKHVADKLAQKVAAVVAKYEGDIAKLKDELPARFNKMFDGLRNGAGRIFAQHTAAVSEATAAKVASDKKANDAYVANLVSLLDVSRLADTAATEAALTKIYGDYVAVLLANCDQQTQALESAAATLKEALAKAKASEMSMHNFGTLGFRFAIATLAQRQQEGKDHAQKWHAQKLKEIDDSTVLYQSDQAAALAALQKITEE